MSIGADPDGFTGDATPLHHSEHQSIIPTFECTDVVEDIISKATSAKDEKLDQTTTTMEAE